MINCSFCSDQFYLYEFTSSVSDKYNELCKSKQVYVIINFHKKYDWIAIIILCFFSPVNC